MKTPRKFDRDLARQLREQGLSLRAIATTLGVSSSAVHEALAKSLPNPPPLPEPARKAAAPHRDDPLGPLRRGDDDPDELRRFAPPTPPGPAGMRAVARSVEDGQEKILRAWQPSERGGSRRLGSTHEWIGEPGAAGSHMEPIAGPFFDTSIYRESPRVEPGPGATGDGIPESARARENTETHAAMAFDLFGNGR